MRNIIALFAAVAAFLSADAQVDDSCHERSFHHDVSQMYVYIETLNRNTLLPLDSLFRTCESNRSDTVSAGNLYGFIKNAIDSIKKYVSLVTRSDFYKGKTDCNLVQDTSYLYYYTHTEMDDYIYSLGTLIQEMKALLPDGKSLLNTFHNTNFLSAYYYMCQSRSMLMATMDNLAHYFDINVVAQNVRKRTDELPTEFTVTKDSIEKEKEQLGSLNRLLLGRFRPYYTEPGGERDKISTAANSILRDNRKNWWWRSLIGGCVAGIVSGLVVHSLK